MNTLRALLLISAAALITTATPTRAADGPGYKIVERIKVSDGGFDYATFDAATGRVYMPRGDFTTIIDAKTGRVSQLASGVSDHIALPIPGTSSIAHLEENVAAAEIKLTPEEWKTIDALAGQG